MPRCEPWHAVIFALCVGAPGCSSPVPLIESAPSAPHPVVVDGEVSEWLGSLTPIPNSPLTLGVRNSATALHLALVSTNTDVLRQVLATGLVVWIDPEGGRARAYGVHFPLGIARDGTVPDDVARGRIPGSGALAQRLEAVLGAFALVRGDERVVHPQDSVPGFEMAAGLQAGTLVLELTLPIDHATLLAVPLSRGQPFGLTIETPSLDRDGLRDVLDERERRRGSADLPGGGATDHLPGRRPPGRGMPEPIRAWVRVMLDG